MLSQLVHWTSAGFICLVELVGSKRQPLIKVALNSCGEEQGASACPASLPLSKLAVEKLTSHSLQLMLEERRYHGAKCCAWRTSD